MACVTPSTLADRLDRERRRRFVGRSPEVGLFEAAMESPDPSFRVLFLHGPGGVGKSALLREYAHVAERAGRVPVQVAGHEITPTPAAFQAAIGDALGRIDDGDSRADDEVAHGTEAGHVLLIDGFEVLAPLEGWLRDQFLPSLPDVVVVVLAGRNPPSSSWRADPGWRDLHRVVSLRNLAPDGTRDYLRIEGVPDEAHQKVQALTHGHPLALSLLVDTIRRSDPPGRIPRALADEPDLVRALLGRMVDKAPDRRHLEALHVCGHANVTTEALLRAVLPGDDVPGLFGWLRDLSFVEQTSAGIRPHDVARTVLNADLRWRDPETYAAVHRAVRGYQIDRTRSGNPAERRRAVTDTIFMLRDHPVAGAYWDWELLGEGYDEPLAVDDLSAAMAMAGNRYGPDQLAALRLWLDRQPQAFRAFRDSTGDLIGFAGYLSLDAASDDDIHADPGTAAVWRYAHRYRPPRPGEQVKAWRFLVDRDVPDERARQTAGTLLGAWHALDILLRGPTAWDFIATYTDVEHWTPFLGHLDFHHVADADFQIDNTTYAVFAHDWRQVSVDTWLDATAERELSDEPVEPDSPPVDLVLSQDEFADAVKEALRHINVPSALVENPLTASALVRNVIRDSVDARTPDVVLRDLVVASVESLRERPRFEQYYRVLDRTFLRPAPSQEKAAELLDLPFSTYRRHRDRAVAEVTRELWHREVYGSPPNSDRPPDDSD